MDSKKDIVKKVLKRAQRIAGRIVSLALKIAGGAVLVVICTGVIFACVAAIYMKTQLGSGVLSDIDVDAFALQESSIIYAKDPETGGYVELVTLYGEENRKLVDYEDMPKHLEHAVVAIEDKRFYEHKGVDWYRTAAAFVNMFLGNKDTFGGSTVTQQLIKNTTQYNDVTVERKLIEIFRALEYEKTHEKEEIIEK